MFIKRWDACRWQSLQTEDPCTNISCVSLYKQSENEIKKISSMVGVKIVFGIHLMKEAKTPHSGYKTLLKQRLSKSMEMATLPNNL